MKLLIMDGIPKDHPEAGYSDKIVDLVMKNTTHKIDYFRLRDMNIHHCTGCWHCWYKTPGKCAIRDDHEAILSRVPHADHLIYVTPVICGYESSLLKTCKDRTIPVIHPYIVLHKGEQHHRKRYDMSPLLNVLLLPDNETTEDDAKLIKRTYERVALNFQSTLNLCHIKNEKGGIDYVLSHI